MLKQQRKSFSNFIFKNKMDDFSLVAPFIKELYEVYKKNHFTYLEINPLGNKHKITKND